MRKALLGAGYATLALDAATHGERSHEIDLLRQRTPVDRNLGPGRPALGPETSAAGPTATVVGAQDFLFNDERLRIPLKEVN